MPPPTGVLDAADRARLSPDHLDSVATALLNLVAEVASLADRVAALEEPDRSDSAPRATEDLVRRVLAPLAAPHEQRS
jgi:hypothetical protein